VAKMLNMSVSKQTAFCVTHSTKYKVSAREREREMDRDRDRERCSPVGCGVVGRHRSVPP